ncbi:MAG TPA: hypothetical protein VHJ20_12735 [Polyangia bacterium]|nr:hypothetical protein [Polyangia bacterium]
MRHRGLTSLALAAIVLAPHAAFAKGSPDKGAASDDEDAQDDANLASGKNAKNKSDAKAAGKSDEADASEDAAPEAPEAKAAPEPEPTPAPSSPVHSRWDTELYGFIELDGMHDSTQSYADGANSNLLARRGTYNGDRGQTQATVKNSRLGFRLNPPEWNGVKTSGVVEVDFFGIQPYDATQNDYYTLGTVRMRHAYLKLRAGALEVLAGQYHDLFGWGGNGFYPNTVAYLGIPGEIYHRNPQLRVSGKLGDESATNVEIAVAAVRPAQRHSEVPDGEAGLRVAFGGWKGVAAQGAGQPQLTPLSIGVSGIARRFVIPQFISQPRASETKYGFGAAADLVIPVIPVKNVEDRANALTVTAEVSIGTGVADMYTGMTGGGKFPELDNPSNDKPPFTYPQDIDSGLITYDADLNLRTYNWNAFVVGAQYYLPVAKGKVWVSGLYSQAQSNNIVDITPSTSSGAIVRLMRYFDANLWAALAPSTHLGLSFQRTQQTYGDESLPVNMRAEIALLFFF